MSSSGLRDARLSSRLPLIRHVRSWIIRAPVGTARYWLCLSVLVSRLGATRWARLKLLVVGLVMPLRDALPWIDEPRAVCFRLEVGGRHVRWLVARKSDFEVLNEVMVLGEYDGVPIAEPETVLDLGSHIGASLLFFRLAYPHARIIGIEPNPAVFPQLQRNADQLEGVEVHEVAVAAEDGQVRFFPAKQAWTSSTRDPGGDARSVMVRARSLDTLFEDLGLDRVGLLKLDIEAGESEVLQASRRFADVDAVVGEFDDLGDAVRREAFFALFDSYSVNVKGGLGEHTTFVAVRT